MANESTAYVTGATGWLGSRLMSALAAPHLDNSPSAKSRFAKIKCFVQHDSDLDAIELPRSDYEVVRGDIRNPDDVEQFLSGAEGSTIFHCAGMIHPTTRTHDLFDINVDGARNLANAAAAASVKRVIAVSSSSIAGASNDRSRVFDETSKPNPYMAYGRSKHRMEQVLDAASRKFQFELVTLRVPWFYGPNQPKRQSRFFSLIRKGRVPVVGSGNNLRSIAYVDDISTALIAASSERASSGRKYWISDGRPYSYNEIILAIENVLEKRFNLEVAHRRMNLPNIVGGVARITDRMIQSAGFYNQSLHVLGELNLNIACDPALAVAELEFKPSVNLEEGMFRSIESCLARDHVI
jgi:nucleoside-diphosphate-sugar epimerase